MIAKACSFVLCMFVLVVPFAIWEGFVVSTLWRWYAVPQFDVSPLSITAAIGLGLLTTCLVPGHIEKDRLDEAQALRVLAHTFLRYTLALGMGWVVLQFGGAA